MVNIFFTDWDPVVAARDSCDGYVVKIPIEVATLLSAIHWRNGYEGPVGSGLSIVILNDTVVPAVGPYKNSKVIHSSSETYRWLVKSTGNYDYAVRYGLELVKEFEKRYGKRHSTEAVLLWLEANVPNIPQGPLTTDVGLAMPDIYKDRSDPTMSYKRYLYYEKFGVMKWTRGRMPEWYDAFKIE